VKSVHVVHQHVTTGVRLTPDTEITADFTALDLKLHSKRVEKIENHTRNGWEIFKTTLETSGDLTGAAVAIFFCKIFLHDFFMPKLTAL
jgi:hypothetical protein